MFATYFGEYPFINLINTLTGWDFDVDELIKIGIRIQILRRSFNLREKVNVINNELPRRVFGDPPFEKGPLKGKKAESKQFYKDYCNEIGWNPKTAIPLENTLKYLDLQFLIKDLY